MNFTGHPKKLRLSYAFFLVVTAIVILLNFLSSRHFARLDLTETQAFDLDPATAQMMQSLDDIVTFKVFFSQELPPALWGVRQYLQDLLEEFKSYGGRRVQVRFLNPEEEAVREEAKRLEIPAVRMNVLSRDKFEVKNGFLGIAIEYGADHEILPVVKSTENLEYDLVTSLRKLTNKELRRVAFSEGHGEYPVISRSGIAGGEGHVLAHAALTRNYLVSTVDLKNREMLLELDTLVLGGPEEPFSLRELYNLDQFLMKGGNLVLLLDGVDVEGFLEARPLELEIGPLLAHYGVRVEPALILDRLNENASFEEGLLEFTLPYPFWVKSVRDYMNDENSIVSQLESMVFPWPSPLKLQAPEGVRFTLLAQTSPQSWLQEPPFDLDPEAKSQGVPRSYPLAVMLEGNFKSFYQGERNLPRDFKSESQGEGRLIVVGNSRFLTDRMVQKYKSNLTFFLNAVDFLTLDQTLLSIRSSGFTDRPLLFLSDTERQLVKFGTLFFMPFLLVLYGLLRALERKKKIVKL